MWNDSLDVQELLVLLFLISVVFPDNYLQLARVERRPRWLNHAMPCGQDPFPVNNGTRTGRCTSGCVKYSCGRWKFMRYGIFSTNYSSKGQVRLEL